VKASLLFLLLLFSSIFLISCNQKSDDLMDSGDWVSRNQECAEQAISDLIKKVEKRALAAKKLQSTIDEMLSKSPCPAGASTKCIPELAIQAIATYMSKVTINSSLDKPAKAPVDFQEDKGSIGDALATNAIGKNKKLIGDSAKTLPDALTRFKGKADSLNSADLGLHPDTLAKKSACMAKVSPACNFLALEKIIVKLILFTKQTSQLEKEIQALLPPPKPKKLDKIKEFSVPDTIDRIYLYLKTLESRTQELTFLESAFRRGKKNYISRYKNLQPEKIKGLIVEISHTIPSSIETILKQYIPMVKKRFEYTKKHKSDYKEKLNASLRNLRRSSRERGSFCLKQKGCWKFRSCVKRYRLPSITVFKNR
jgi:hypothetical protein